MGRGSSQCTPPTGSWAPPCGRKARWRPCGCRPWSRRTPPSLWTQTWRRVGDKGWAHRDNSSSSSSSSRIQINSLPEIITTGVLCGWYNLLPSHVLSQASYRNTLKHYDAQTHTQPESSCLTHWHTNTHVLQRIARAQALAAVWWVYYVCNSCHGPLSLAPHVFLSAGFKCAWCLRRGWKQ